MLKFLFRVAAVGVSYFYPAGASTTIYPTFKLSSVNGISGSVFNGEFSNDQSGSSVVNVRDMNGDRRDDFAIGSPGAPFTSTYAGKVYVVYGTDAGFNPEVDLSTLNGTNGFVILGESLGDRCGFALAAGDFNNDGLSDLAVGAPYALGAAGKVYLIYGRSDFNATLPLATLGNKGFITYGASTNHGAGSSLAIAPNFHSSGFSDLVIGAVGASGNTGLVAVVFGTNKTVSGVNISALNGTTGFVVPGIFSAGSSGVVTAGDLNGDGLGDIAIAAPYAASNTGFVVVIFGTNKSFSANFNVSLLNGTNGFSMDGVSEQDALGFSMAVGDVNNDGKSDLLMGAPYASPGGRDSAGSAFVLFGKPYFSAKEDLSKLNGTNGYRINGDLALGSLGISVGAGRINGDGFSDVIVGAPYASPENLYQAGSTFVIFGTNETVSPILELPGSNNKVLRMDGSSASMNSGFSVASADIRGDGYGLSAVIIGANMASPGNALKGGATYLVYGDSIPSAEYQLTIPAGGSRTLMPSDFNASVSRYPEYTQYTITALKHGYFLYTNTTQPNTEISTFSGRDIMMGLVNFTHDDTELAPGFSVTATHTLVVTSAHPANVTFINRLPEFVNNTWVIKQGETIRLEPTMLAAVDPDNAQHNAEIVFTILGSSNGFFSPPSFFQSQIWDGGVYYTHANTILPPQFRVMISRGGVTIGPDFPVIDFYTTPVLDQNHFDICQGQTKIVTANMLSAIHPGTNSSDSLMFTIQNLQYGRFQDVNAPGQEILSFPQAAIKNQTIQFVHDGSRNPASFRFTISSNRITTPSDFAGIYFTEAPVLLSNELPINQEQTVILDSSMIDAIDSNINGLSKDLRFVMSEVREGFFSNIATNTTNITQFNQSQVAAKKIAFQSTSANAPSYNVLVQNECSQTVPAPVRVKFNSAPVITSNQITIKNHQPVILTSAQLSAIDKETPLDLVFTISNLQGGRFEAITLPGTAITVFPQQMIFNGAIRFVPDSDTSPAYYVNASDGVLSSASQALVTLENTPPVAEEDTPSNPFLTSVYVFFGVTLPLGLVFWGFKRWGDACCDNKLETQVQRLAIDGRDAQWTKDVLLPMMKLILNRAIKNPRGWCGYPPAVVDDYAGATTELISKLEESGVVVNFSTIPDDTERNSLQSTIVDKIRYYATLGTSPSACCNLLLKCCCLPDRPAMKADQLKYSANNIAEAVAKDWQKGGEVELERISGEEQKLTVEERLASLEAELATLKSTSRVQVADGQEASRDLNFSQTSGKGMSIVVNLADHTLGANSAFTETRQRLSGSA